MEGMKNHNINQYSNLKNKIWILNARNAQNNLRKSINRDKAEKILEILKLKQQINFQIHSFHAEDHAAQSTIHTECMLWDSDNCNKEPLVRMLESEKGSILQKHMIGCNLKSIRKLQEMILIQSISNSSRRRKHLKTFTQKLKLLIYAVCCRNSLLRIILLIGIRSKAFRKEHGKPWRC